MCGIDCQSRGCRIACCLSASRQAWKAVINHDSVGDHLFVPITRPFRLCTPTLFCSLQQMAATNSPAAHALHGVHWR
jgi:hypothetical protein